MLIYVRYDKTMTVYFSAYDDWRLFDTALNFIQRLRFEKCEHFQKYRDYERVWVYRYRVRLYLETRGSYNMKVFSYVYSKFPGVRFPWRVYANSLLARISFLPTFSLPTYPRFRSIRSPFVVCFCAHNFFSFAAGDCDTPGQSLSVYRLRTSQKLIVHIQV